METSRPVTDFIQGFLAFTETAPSPYLYRKWAGIYCVAAAMGKRTWCPTENGDIFPNMAVILVGDPGVGKGPAIDPAELLLRSIDKSKNALRHKEGIRVGPNDTTAPGMFDELLEESSQKHYSWNGKEYTFQSMVLISEELSAFFHSLDLRMMGYFIRLLNGQSLSQRLRKQENLIEIPNPLISILGGVQPNVLQEIFPATAWGMGLTARTMFVFSDKVTPQPLFALNEEDLHYKKTIRQNPLFPPMSKTLDQISKLTGPFSFTREAALRINAWHLDGESTKSRLKHPRLINYSTKRIQHFIRLVMARNASRTDSMLVEIQDVDMSLRDLLEVEAVMPAIFSAMTSTDSKADAVGDIAHQIYAVYNTTRQPLPHHIVLNIISQKVPIYAVNTTLEQLLSQHLLEEQKLDRRFPGAGGRKGYIPTDIVGDLDELFPKLPSGDFPHDKSASHLSGRR
jgi:Protein of unknown function (DUF3987)